MKIKSTAGLVCIVFLFLSIPSAYSQTGKTGEGKLQTLSDRPAGFTVHYQGTLIKKNQGEYLIDLSGPANAEHSGGRVHIFLSRQPFVYLPGTYGGRFYFETDKTPNTAADYVRGDSVTVNGIRFARDYWAVYAGMGQWETVDNCYTIHGGRCYTISLTRNFKTVMPGQTVNGTRTTKEQLRSSLIGKMRDTSDVNVKSFNEILKSFSITK